ncbi:MULTISPECIES: hypothetical protein [unclassified Halomonas]|mgnify:FL=1|uniref:hypothetical protein n=1 Tax=unclassified Halomonas TaxID=2609666 RepID=UPI000C51D52B|nr:MULTISPECIES: hypothetical protein [unclassified Halomonas]MAY72800.1 hypothetical protein [Halomonas sp.]MBY6110933.1 hypothetical protein [Halomonas sp. DP1Y21-3]MCJ8285139.1 hypothetical protein [Halomonas sp.]NQY70189.1 hypothetical protein [Halomonas sp.]
MSASDDIQDFLRKTGSDTAGYQAFGRTNEEAGQPRWGLLGQLSGHDVDPGDRPSRAEPGARLEPLQTAAEVAPARKGKAWATLEKLPAAPAPEPACGPAARPAPSAVAERSEPPAGRRVEHQAPATNALSVGEASPPGEARVPPAGRFGHLFRSASDKASSEAATGKETPLKPLLKRISQ